MPATKNAMTRYKILDELLSNQYHDHTLDDLTEEVNKRLCEIDPDSGVTRRCIEKDLDYLEHESDFMVEIDRYYDSAISKRTGKICTKRFLKYKDSTYSIFKKSLSDDEVYLLREALSLLGQFDGLPNLEALEELRVRLKGRDISQQIISFTKNPLGDSSILGELFTAISNKQVIEIAYTKFGTEELTQKFRLHPYLLKEYNRRWYLVAASFEDEKELIFALDRMNSVTPCPLLEYKPFEGDINERFDDIIGVTLFDNEEIQHIVFWASEREKNYIRTKPLHDSQKYYKGENEMPFRQQYPMLQGGAFFSIDCKRNIELIRELCSYGKGLVVLSPDGIKADVKRRILEMIDTYRLLDSL